MDGRVLAVTVRRRIRLSEARARGVSVALKLQRWDTVFEDRVVRVRLFSVAHGRKHLAATIYRTLSTTRPVRLPLRSPALRRGLRLGLYEVDASSGVTRSSLRGLAVGHFRVVR
jgi:hypothetical protein